MAMNKSVSSSAGRLVVRYACMKISRKAESLGPQSSKLFFGREVRIAQVGYARKRGNTRWQERLL